MSDKILDVINPEGDLKEQLEAIRKNFLSIQKNMLGAAAQILFEGTLAADLSLTASYQTLSDLTGSFTCSGGLVFFNGFACTYSNGTAITIRLVIDDGVKRIVGTSDVDGRDSVPIVWCEKMTPGPHKFKIEAIGTGGSGANIEGGDSTNGETGLYILEFLV